MPLGKQGNVGQVDFVPGKSTEALIERYNAQLTELDTTRGALFLIDTWRGSPFNAVNRIVVDKEHHEVIVGVNIPMLVETLVVRDDNPSFGELAALAVEIGRGGVKALKAKPVGEVALAPAAAVPKVAPTPAKPMGPNDYMVIGLTRTGNRLIHGQVATRWVKETNASHIIVASDEVAVDTICKALLTQVVLLGVATHVVNVAKVIRIYSDPEYAGERVMLLFTNPTDIERPTEGGVKITSASVSGMTPRQNRTQVDSAVSADEKDIKAFKKLNMCSIELETRKVSTDPELKMMDLISKIDK